MMLFVVEELKVLTDLCYGIVVVVIFYEENVIVLWGGNKKIGTTFSPRMKNKNRNKGSLIILLHRLIQI